MSAVVEYLNVPFHQPRPDREQVGESRKGGKVVTMARFFVGRIQRDGDHAGAAVQTVAHSGEDSAGCSHPGNSGDSADMGESVVTLAGLLKSCSHTRRRAMTWCGYEDPMRPDQAPSRFEVPVSGMTLDSRQVTRGDLFVALRGTAGHGLEYLDKALEAGAVAVLWEQDPDSDWQAFVEARCKWMTAVGMEDLRSVIGHLAGHFFQAPSGALSVVGVTGTDGKTSIAQLLAAALNQGPINQSAKTAETAYSHQCGVLGTMGNGFTGELEPTLNTTPDVVSVHGWLGRFRKQGASQVVMEVSSHGLDQDRVQGVRFDTAVFTNLSRDHLDYHKTQEAYARAKRRLFEADGLNNAVINADDLFGRALLNRPAGPYQRIAYGHAHALAQVEAELRVVIEEARADEKGLFVRFSGDFGDFEAHTGLLGVFNGQNLAAIYAVMRLQGLSNTDIARRFAQLKPVAGRMEAVESIPGADLPLVVVDYAHTPAALEAVQLALREHLSETGRLLTVFGCGGDRDQGKRPLMGGAAQKVADAVWVTDDNPRSEDPAQIVEQILEGLDPASSTPVQIQHDRATAIDEAISCGHSGDVVLIAGKGHEDYQLIGDQRHWFSDRHCAAQILSEAGGSA